MQDTAKLNELKHRASVNGDKEKRDKLKRLCHGCSISHYSLTEVRSLQGNIRPRFPCNDRTDEVYKLFIVDTFLTAVN